MKHSINAALSYAILALVGGVFYREFTRTLAFTGKTTLSVVHTHYFLLGMVVFLLLLLLERQFALPLGAKHRTLLLFYHIGLNLTNLMLVVRGVIQVLEIPLTPALQGAVSGLAGLGHITLGISLILLLWNIRKAVIRAE